MAHALVSDAIHPEAEPQYRSGSISGSKGRNRDQEIEHLDVPVFVGSMGKQERDFADPEHGGGAGGGTRPETPGTSGLQSGSVRFAHRPNAAGGSSTDGAVGSGAYGSTLDFIEESGKHQPIMNLTVSEPSRVEAELENIVDANQAPSKTVTIIKWSAMIAMFLAVLVCLTASKVSLLEISSDLMAARINRALTAHHQAQVQLEGQTQGHGGGQRSRLLSEGQSGSVRAETDFLMLLLILLIPCGLSLLRSFWCGGFRSDKPWPCWKALAAVSNTMTFPFLP